ncbi:EscU/YscU/HrcU family type III secretion system export apparatus switch protein [Porticoccus sp.]
MPDDAPSPALRQAVALSYQDGDQAPRVIARGYGLLAERMIELARQNDIFVHDSPEMVGLLMQLDIDQCIPPELYRAIAELLVWLRNVDRDIEAE